jgi:hypothetical protein
MSLRGVASDIDKATADSLYARLDGANQPFTAPVLVPDVTYSDSWNGDLSVPTKNAIYDKLETALAGIPKFTYFV